MNKIFLILLLFVASLASAQTTLKGSDTARGSVVVGGNVVSVQTPSLPNGIVGTPYSQTLAATGGTPPYVWSLFAGSPPPSVTLSGTGVVAGSPSAPGTFSFSVVATDQNGAVSNPKNFTIVVVSGSALTINNTSFPGFPFGQAYGQPINVSGGSGSGYVCSLNSGSLPTGVSVNTDCTIGLTATNVGGSIGASFTFSLHVVDSLSNTFNSGNFTTLVIQPCGPPNYGCAGRAIIPGPPGCTPSVNCTTFDNCVLQVFGGGASNPGCPPTNSSIPDMHNGFSTCTQGVNCTAPDPQYNNVLMTRCTDATLNGTITTAPFVNRLYSAGQGSSSDTNAFTTDSSMLSVIDSGNRTFIESIDTTAHTCYPIFSAGAPWRPGSGEFGGTTKGHYYSFFNFGVYQILLYQITCTTPGHSGTPCTAPVSSTVAADFSTVFPGVTALPWAASTSYSYGKYVTAYLTNSQHSSITAATCTSNVITYTLSPGITTLETGTLVTVSGLSTFNGTALLIATANAPGTTATVSTSCVNGASTGTGLMTEGSNVLFQNLTAGTHSSGSSTPSWNPASLTNTTDSGITWMASGTTNTAQGGGWVSQGGVSTDETQFSAGISNNNFDNTAKGALNISMNGNQNTGFFVYTYDATGDIYTEWNTGSGIVKTLACTAQTATITAWSITSNVATMTATNTYTAGQTVSLSGFIAGAAIFNGFVGTVSATGLSGSSFQIAITHANTSGSETTAVANAVGPLCTRGVAGITVQGQINVTSTSPCSSTPCQFYLHNVKIFKGGAFNEVTPEFCTLIAGGGPGNCPSNTKYMWQKATTTVNGASFRNAGHQTEHYALRFNTPANGSQVGVMRNVTTNADIISTTWTNPNVIQFDSHWGWVYLNGAVDDTIVTPVAGATFNSFEFPFTTPYENEILVVPTCGVPAPVATPACGASELQNSQVAREGHTYSTGSSFSFNTQQAIGAFSQDGAVYAVSTDYACQLGSLDGGPTLCGFPWSANFSYPTNAMIEPTSGPDFKSTNPGSFVYKVSGACTSGATQPKPFNQTVGGTTTDGTCTWTNQGAGNQRGDVILYWLQ